MDVLSILNVEKDFFVIKKISVWSVQNVIMTSVMNIVEENNIAVIGVKPVQQNISVQKNAVLYLVNEITMCVNPVHNVLLLLVWIQIVTTVNNIMFLQTKKHKNMIRVLIFVQKLFFHFYIVKKFMDVNGIQMILSVKKAPLLKIITF